MAIRMGFNELALKRLITNILGWCFVRHPFKEHEKMVVNGTKYTDAEWKHNQRMTLVASVLFVWGFILLWWILG